MITSFFLLMQVALASPHEGKVVTHIEIKGLKRTEEFVVHRELLVKEETPFRQADFEESITRLKNLQIFSKVEGSVSKSRGGVKVRFDLEDKWTLIPFSFFGGSADTQFLTLGAFEGNFLGRYLEIGGQWDWLGGQNSGKIWFEDPRFLDKRVLFRVEAGLTRNRRPFYALDRTFLGSYKSRTTGATLSTLVEIHRHLRVGGSLSARSRLVEDRDPKDGSTQAILLKEETLPTHQFILGPLAYVRFGRMNYDLYQAWGKTSQLSYGLGISPSGQPTHKTITSDSRVVWKLPLKSNFGMRLLGRHTSAREVPSWIAVGGLNNVKGFLYSQFSTKNLLQLNTEFRIASLDTPWISMQHALFLDAGRTAFQFNELFGSEALFFSGVGVGLRITSPKIYRIGIRIDLAHSMGDGARGQSFFFGLKSFY